MATFTFTIHSRYMGADVTEEIEIEDLELQSLSEDEREAYIDRVCKEWMLENVEWGWEEE